MKKLNISFLCFAVVALISLFATVTVYSLATPLQKLSYEGRGTVPVSGGFSGAAMTILMIAAPVALVLFTALAIGVYRKALDGNGLCSVLEDKRKNLSPIHLFAICASVVTISSLIFMCVHRNTVWDYHLFLYGEDGYMDFFNHITYARYPSETYSRTVHACFPPLAYIMYFLFSLIIPTDATVKHRPDLTSPYAMLVCVMYTVFLCILFAYIARKMLSGRRDRLSWWIISLLLLSGAFISAIERANSVIIVLIALLGAMLLKDSDKPWKRECALILIAVAAAFKIYPAIFGALYLIEKRYKEAVRLIIYGVLFFFVPFIFFGGFNGLMLFVSNQFAIQNDNYASFSTVSSMVRLLVATITGSPSNLKILSVIATVLFTVLCAVAFFNKRLALWEKTMLLVSVICFAPSWSGTYTTIFFAIPLLLFFKECKDDFGQGITKAYNIAVAVGFALSFCLITFVTPSGRVLCEYVRYVTLHFVNILVIIKAFRSYAVDARAKKVSK